MHASPTDPTPGRTPSVQMEQLWRRGSDAHRRRDWRGAEAAFDLALQCNPDDALVALNLAHARHKLGDDAGALAATRRCLACEPDNAIASLLAGQVHVSLHGEAPLRSYLSDIEQDPMSNHLVLTAVGHALYKQRRVREAIDALMSALARRPHHVEAHRLLMFSFRDLGLKREAVECAKTLLALEPDDFEALLHMEFDQREACEWGELEQHGVTVTRLALQGAKSSCADLPSFELLSNNVPPGLHVKVASISSARLARGVLPLPAVTHAQRRPGRLRLGFYSYDFRVHPVAQLLVETLELLDRSRCEVFLFSYGPDDDSGIRRRLIRGVDHFIDIETHSQAASAQRIRDEAIDILIDINGYTRGSRIEVLALRPAPIQVEYLGYPGSTGADFVDYLIGDPVVTPLSQAGLYSERLAQLDGCVLPGMRGRPVPAPMTRTEAGLPEAGLVMCNFNHPYKILPQAFEIWCDVLRQQPDAVLWLKRSNDQMIDSLQREAQRRWVDPERLVFAQNVPFDVHFSRLALADVLVDTWPYNAHTTASDALWAGVPVLTLQGEAFASRVASSLLIGAGLPELICQTPEDYHARLLAFARDPASLAGVRQHLRDRRDELPIFDPARYAEALLSLFERMAERRAAGLAPAHLPAKAHRAECPLPDTRLAKQQADEVP